MRETTQGKIAFILSLMVLLLSWTGLLILYYLVEPFHKFIFIIPLIISIVLFILSIALVETFILQKIRILYRIASTIGVVKEKDRLRDPELFEKLRSQVEEYAIQKSKEVESLKENEEFRKEFLGNVSHELKTPLYSIQGFTEILQNENLSQEESKKYLDKISKNTIRLEKIVQDLLTITKADQNKLVLEIESFDILDLFNEVVLSFENQIKAKRTKISLEINKSILVHADRFRISQVITNLIGNAIQYNPVKTTIKINFIPLNEKLIVEINDNGVGIHQEHLSHIFERFYRLDKDRNRDNGGSGLGLSIVKNIIEAHGETIVVESLINHGSTFRFTLPLIS